MNGVNRIYEYKGIFPRIHASVLLAPGSIIIGDVEIGENSSVWCNTVIRGDVNYIRIGQRVNIQDLSMLHVTRNTHPLRIGNDVTIAHSVVLHGCDLQDYSFIGMGAIIMDGAKIGKFSFVAAGSLVPPGMEVADGMLAMGRPARIVRPINEKEREMIIQSPVNYQKYATGYQGSGFAE